MKQAEGIWSRHIVSMKSEWVHIYSLTMKTTPWHFCVTCTQVLFLCHTNAGSVVPSAAVVTADGLTAPATLNLTPTTWKHIFTSDRTGVRVYVATNEQYQQMTMARRDTRQTSWFEFLAKLRKSWRCRHRLPNREWRWIKQIRAI